MVVMMPAIWRKQMQTLAEERNAGVGSQHQIAQKSSILWTHSAWHRSSLENIQSGSVLRSGRDECNAATFPSFFGIADSLEVTELLVPMTPKEI